ncbi:MAG: CDP-diacylglycerol--glycerol-3-phosphate 3-phosphatidyltransferase [Methanobrevibacter sp.]|uniref:CDP-diacylglycerol--glycerol-3-phosphate 3-phosphatidyltransferase n=1 Tax=Methanobrevibacter sp. TaxID=66852 RepID=UPI0025E2A7FC|nr:CDP-diacylglycerol--glycerol-3-phosphate 3-phosphatidyltransferase [Methanobrevibacter sp.]MBQ8018526.1 CDP-diacylglycerol--glycerol-3-phosphate 3-phosphatidyltransferase [Methanobrevibacter sp.]
MAKNDKKKGMNLPNKLTILRLVISAVVLVILCIPWSSLGIEWPIYSVKTLSLDFNLEYIVVGILFAIGSLTDVLDGYLARKYNSVTDFGKVMDAIADKVLVNGVLIILASSNFIPVIVPVIVISRDIAVDSLKMVVGKTEGAVQASWHGKIKTVCMMIGIILLFIIGIPLSSFENSLYRIDLLFIYVATILSIISGYIYFDSYKDYIFSDI